MSEIQRNSISIASTRLDNFPQKNQNNTTTPQNTNKPSKPIMGQENPINPDKRLEDLNIKNVKIDSKDSVKKDNSNNELEQARKEQQEVKKTAAEEAAVGNTQTKVDFSNPTGMLFGKTKADDVSNFTASYGVVDNDKILKQPTKTGNIKKSTLDNLFKGAVIMLTAPYMTKDSFFLANFIKDKLLGEFQINTTTPTIELVKSLDKFENLKELAISENEQISANNDPVINQQVKKLDEGLNNILITIKENLHKETQNSEKTIEENKALEQKIDKMIQEIKNFNKQLLEKADKKAKEESKTLNKMLTNFDTKVVGLIKQLSETPELLPTAEQLLFNRQQFLEALFGQTLNKPFQEKPKA